MKHIEHLLILLIIFLILFIPIAEASKPPPHINPSQIPAKAYPTSLLHYYIDIFTGILYPGEYNISSLINLLKYSGYSSNIMYVVNRLNEYILLFNNYLNETKFHIDRAELLMNYSAYDEALNELEKAKYNIIKANMTYQEINPVLNELTSLIGRYTEYTSVKKFHEARVKLDKLLSTIEHLMTKLRNIIKMNYENAKENYELYFENKTRTYILFKLNTSSIWVGESIFLNGILTTENTSLPYRKILIKLYNRSYTVLTNETGEFNIVLQVINIYKSRIRLDLFYTPKGNDSRLYTPSHNSTIINLSYINTSIDIYCDKIGYPGKPINITIHITPSETLRNTLIYIDDKLIKTQQSTDTLKIKYILPGNISLGKHVLKAVVSANGIYGSGLGIYMFTVEYKPVYLNTSLNTYLAIYPFTRVSVNGILYTDADRPLVNKTLEVYIGSQIIHVKTDSNGRFNIKFSPPLYLGSYRFNIYFKPDKPWFTYVSRTFTIFIFPSHLLLIIPVLIAVLYYYIKRVNKEEIVSEGEEKSETIFEEAKVEETKSIVSHGPASKYYMDILNILSKKGYSIKPYETIREYYNRIRDYLGEYSKKFWTLTLLTEYEIFSGEKLSDRDVERAEALYKDILKRVVE